MMKQPLLVVVVSTCPEHRVRTDLGSVLTGNGLFATHVINPSEYLRYDYAPVKLILIDRSGLNSGKSRDIAAHGQNIGKPSVEVYRQKGSDLSELVRVVDGIRSALPSSRPDRSIPPPPVMPRVTPKVPTSAEIDMQAEIDMLRAANERMRARSTQPKPEPPPEPAIEVVQTNDALALVHVPFDGGHLEAVRKPDGTIWAGVRRACENLGVNADGQRVKLQNAAWACTEMISVQDASGRIQPMFMLRADCVAKWAAEIDANRVRPEIRPKLERMQAEARDVLAAWFTPGAAHSAGVDVEAIGAALVATGQKLRAHDASLARMGEDVRVVMSLAGEAQREVKEKYADLDTKLRQIASTMHPRKKRAVYGQLGFPAVRQAIIDLRRGDLCQWAMEIVRRTGRDPNEWVEDRTLFTKIHGHVFTRCRQLAECAAGAMKLLTPENIETMAAMLPAAARHVGQNYGVELGDWKPPVGGRVVGIREAR
ncbi:MAG: phage antirepressor N-terminal domain-containing protein [Actinomycetota bacterium]